MNMVQVRLGICQIKNVTVMSTQAYYKLQSHLRIINYSVYFLYDFFLDIKWKKPISGSVYSPPFLRLYISPLLLLHLEVQYCDSLNVFRLLIFLILLLINVCIHVTLQFWTYLRLWIHIKDCHHAWQWELHHGSVRIWFRYIIQDSLLYIFTIFF